MKSHQGKFFALLIVALFAIGVSSSPTVAAQNAATASSNGCPSNSSNAPLSVVLAIDDQALSSSVWQNGTVSLAIPLVNQGNNTAANVLIQNVTAPSASYLGPASFPYGIGTLSPGQEQALYAEFTIVPLLQHTKYPLIVNGSYSFAGSLCSFQAQTFVIPLPATNAGTPKSTATVETFTVDTASYTLPLPHGDELPNGEGEFFIPIGQPRNLFATPPPATQINASLAFNPNDQTPPDGSNANDVVFLRNQPFGTGGVPPDPSVAGADPSGFVMISSNVGVSYSKDFGKTFTGVPLTKAAGFSDTLFPRRTDFFPQSDGGLCCDQVLLYVPGPNLMVWVLQYWSPNTGAVVFGTGIPIKGQNRLRIAWATPQAASRDFLHAWRWFDVSPAILGDNTVTDWMDYPDVAYTNNNLYIGVDFGDFDFCNPPAPKNCTPRQAINNSQRWVIRASLNDLVNASAVNHSLSLEWYVAQQTGVAKAHFAQGASNTTYYAARPDTSTLMVFADADSSHIIPAPTQVVVSRFCDNDPNVPCNYTIKAPDSPDWTVTIPHVAPLGATFVSTCQDIGSCAGGFFGGTPANFLYFAFDSGKNDSMNRPYPYVRVEKIDATTMNLISEFDIWNSDFAFTMPALGWRPGSAKDEVAVSVATGGGSTYNIYADNAVGFLGDSLFYKTTSSNATQSDPTGTIFRYGDYFNVRNSIGPVTQRGQGVGYSTLVYAVTQQVPGQPCTFGCNVTPQYVLFGRNGDAFPSPAILPPK